MKESLYCPTCGKPTTFVENPEWLLSHFSGKMANMIAALIVARKENRGLTITELAEAAFVEYEYNKTKMPSDPINGLLCTIVANRPKMNELGWTIVSHDRTKNGYWLVSVQKK